MQEIRSSNPSVVIGICDPNKSQGWHHRRQLKLCVDSLSKDGCSWWVLKAYFTTIKQAKFSWGTASRYIGKHWIHRQKHGLYIQTKIWLRVSDYQKMASNQVLSKSFE